MNKLSNNGISGIESFVLFQNSQGENGRGTLIHLSKNKVVFEAYNPFSIVQLSEVLKEVRIYRGERAIYSGRAVVSNLMPTGLMVICSATLLDAWSELADLVPGQGLRAEVERLIQQWEATPPLRPLYQSAVNKLRTFMGEIRRLLEQVDVATEARWKDSSINREGELFEEIKSPIFFKMKELVGTFELEASQIPPEETWPHIAFMRQELHPYFLCSPYVHRTYSKPLGYAGDYEMVNMMFREPLEGQNTYAKLVNFACLEQGPVKAHRNRIEIIYNKIKQEARKALQNGKLLRVMNLGCGPAIEIQKLIMEDEISENCEFHLLDFNEETITYARTLLQELIRQSGKKIELKFIHKSTHELLKDVATRNKSAFQHSFNMIYCAGLFDYLSDRVCKRILEVFYNWLEPGGRLIATNVHPRNSIRYFMEHLVEWHLIYRDESMMAALSPSTNSHQVFTDSTGLNVFLEIHKEDH